MELRNSYNRARRLYNASREERLAALAAIPKLIDVLKRQGEQLLSVIEKAQKAAEKL